MNYENFMDYFLKEFPDLEGTISVDDIDSGLYIVFMNSVNPRILDLLENDQSNRQALTKYFNFFEKMASCDDEEVNNLLMTSTLEQIGDYPNLLLKAQNYMGPETMQLSNKVELLWGRK